MTQRADWTRVETVFHEVADLPPGRDRDRRVAELCGDDAQVQAEVQVLLDGDALAHQAEGALDPHVELRLGPYTVTRLIARGGMAAVYEGQRDDGAFTQRVAIKIMDLRLSDPALVAQFGAERQILAGLEHPSVTRLMDGGVTALGEPYLVMEYVDGQPLDRYGDERRLSLSARLDLFAQVCDAVAYAHRLLVLHRDLKPSNILVTAEGRVKVVDFGTATLLQPDRLATTSVVPLTPAYASPEQLTGKPVGTASDQYSLGVVLYELLTGVAPFGDRPSLLSAIERALAGTTTTAPHTVVTDAAAAARQTSLARLRRLLATDLGTIVTRTLAPEPGARYASVQHLADDLTRWATGAPITARPPSVTYRVSRFVQRHWAASGVAAVLSLGLALATATSLRAADDAREQAVRADAQGRRATEVTRFLTTMLASADPGELGKDATVLEVMQEAAKDAAALDTTPELAAEVRAIIAKTFLSLGDYPAAEEQYRLAIGAERRATPAGSAEIARLLTELSHVIESDGRLDDATRVLDEAAVLLQRHPDAHAAIRFEHLEERGRIQALRGEFQQAASAFESALALARAAPLPAEARTRAAADLGFALSSLGRHAESLPLYVESIEQARVAFGAGSVEVADRLSPYASALWFAGRRTESMAAYEEAIALRLATQGAEHPAYAWTVTNYVDSLVILGQHTKAESLAREVLALRGKTLNDSHPMVPVAMFLIGRAIGPLGRLDEAERWLREGYALRLRTLPAGHYLLASSRSIIGAHLVLAKRLAEAEPMLLAAERDLTTALGNDSPTVAAARQRIVDLYVAWKRVGDAEAWRAKLPAAR